MNFGDGFKKGPPSSRSPVRERCACRNGGRLFTVKLKDEFYPVYVTRYVKTWNDCDAVETWYELRHDEQGAMWGQSPSLSISVTMVQIFRNCAVGGDMKFGSPIR